MFTTSTTMAAKLKKVALKLLTEEAQHLDRWSRGQARSVRQGTHSMLVLEDASSESTLTREYISTQSMLTRELESTQSAIPHEHASHAGRWACKHTKHVGSWACKHARHVAKWAHKAPWYVSTQRTLAREHVLAHSTQFSRII